MKNLWLWSKWKILEAKVGNKLFGLSVMVDLNNACSMACPSCSTSFATRKAGKMNMESFIRVLDKIESQTKIKNILLYLFGEPMINPYVGDAVAECKRRGIKRVMISTNLSHTKYLESVLSAGLDELRISFSGFENGEYFHKGRNMEQFIGACKYLSYISKPYKTKISLIWHRYKTNRHEYQKVKEFAKDMGFHLIVEPAFFISWKRIVEKTYSAENLELISHLDATPEEATANLPYQDYCYYQRRQIPIDANGKTYLCRHMTEPEFITGDILKDSIPDILDRMKNHDFCKKCKAHKLNTFAP